MVENTTYSVSGKTKKESLAVVHLTRCAQQAKIRIRLRPAAHSTRHGHTGRGVCLVMDGFRNPQYTGQPLGNIMFPGGYIQGMPQMAQMGVPHQMMPGPGDGRTVPQMALMLQAPPQRKDAKPKVHPSRAMQS